MAKKSVSLATRQAICFSILIKNSMDIFPSYLSEKWTVFHFHPVPEKALHPNLRKIVYEYLKQHNLYDDKYEAMLKFNGID